MKRSEALAQRFEQANRQLFAVLDRDAGAGWDTICPAEGWSVGTVVHHLAQSYPRVMATAAVVAAGREAGAITWEQIHAGNARHAREFPAPDRPATLADLRRAIDETARSIRALDDDALARRSAWGLANGAPTSAAELIETHLIDHARQHLASIAGAIRA